MGLRQRKKLETRRALMVHALRLFAERGYEQTTVEDIAAAADVSPRTFFRYYPRKADVLFGDIEERQRALARALGPAAADGPLLERLRRVVLGIAGEFAAEPKLFAERARLVFAHEELHGEVYLRMTRLEALLREGVARELGTDPELDVRPRLAAAMVTAALRSTALTWAARGGRGDPREIVNESFDVIESGISSVLPGAGL